MNDTNTTATQGRPGSPDVTEGNTHTKSSANIWSQSECEGRKVTVDGVDIKYQSAIYLYITRLLTCTMPMYSYAVLKLTHHQS